MSLDDEPSSLQRTAVVFFLLVLLVGSFVLKFVTSHIKQTRKRNRRARAALFKRLGLEVQGRKRRTVIGFFHPFCNAGGGGERVLWQAVEFQLRQDSNAVVVVYSGDVDDSTALSALVENRDTSTIVRRVRDGAIAATKDEILAKCRARFGIALSGQQYRSRICFLPLSDRIMVSDSYWKHLTLLGQSYGSMRMAFDACSQLLPDVWIDTMGYAFTYPIVRMFNSSIPIGGYVHYPTISTDMLRRVRNREAGHTNSSDVSGSRLRSTMKLIYYYLFASLYTWALRRSDVLVGNGSWTQGHLNQLLLGESKAQDFKNLRYVHVVYPPCDTSSLSTFPLTGRDALSIVSLAQFRPEKEHSTQLRIVHRLILHLKESGQGSGKIHLCCMGSSRNKEDEERVEDLKSLAKEMGIEENVSFVVNAPYSTIVDRLSKSSIGLSTMVDEHFGINVVEFMAAGLITLSHASAGPLLDIAVPTSAGQATGFHAKTIEEFVGKAEMIIGLEPQDQLAIRTQARARAIDIFSNEAFCNAWQERLWSRLEDLSFSKKT